MKSEFRRFFLNLRREMYDDYIRDKSDLIIKKLLACDLYKEAKSIFVYYSIDKEVDTRNFIKKALADKKEVYLPKIIEKKMQATSLSSLDDIVDGAFGIPTSIRDKFIKNPDLTICPGLSFDRNKNRLGYGAGYYDKFLSLNKTKKIGLMIGDFESIKIPADKWDVKMDYIITDEEIF